MIRSETALLILLYGKLLDQKMAPTGGGLLGATDAQDGTSSVAPWP